MFSKEDFAEILCKINNLYSTMTEFADTAKLDRTYISKYINKKLDNPPTPKILEKIASASKGLTTYEELMMLCGYINTIRGDRLKGCRLSRNLSLEEVSSKVGISSKQLNYWENGHSYNLDIEVLNKLADLYSVNTGWLLGSCNPLFAPKYSNDVRMASYNGIDTEGLDEDDIAEINLFIEKFIKPRKEKNK